MKYKLDKKSLCSYTFRFQTKRKNIFYDFLPLPGDLYSMVWTEKRAFQWVDGVEGMSNAM